MALLFIFDTFEQLTVDLSINDNLLCTLLGNDLNVTRMRLDDTIV